MGSDAYYRIWLYDDITVPATPAWKEVVRYQNFEWQMSYSSPDHFKATVFVKNDPLLASLITPSRVFRITKINSTDGTVTKDPLIADDPLQPAGTEVMTGTLYLPDKEDITAPDGEAPIIQTIEGFGFDSEVIRMTYEGETISHPLDSTVKYTKAIGPLAIGRLVSVVLGDVNDNYQSEESSPKYVVFGGDGAAGSLAKGAVCDTAIGNELGFTALNNYVKFRKDSAYSCLLDIAAIGDRATQYPYQVLIDYLEGDIDGAFQFTPRVNFLSPVNEDYVFPNGFTGVYSADPRDGSAMHSGYTLSSGVADPDVISYPDERRILNFKEYVDVHTYDEKDRMKNKVQVYVTGMGSGNITSTSGDSQGQRASYVHTNPASVSAFDERKFTDFYPFIQPFDDDDDDPDYLNELTANQFAETLLNTYKGHDRYLGWDSVISATNVATGVRRAIVELKTGEVWNDDYFNANIGETVSILRRGDDPAITDKLIGYGYDQNTSSLIAIVGIPPYELASELGRQTRRLERQMALMEVTGFKGTADVTAGTSPVDHTLTIQATAPGDEEGIPVEESSSVVWGNGPQPRAEDAPYFYSINITLNGTATIAGTDLVSPPNDSIHFTDAPAGPTSSVLYGPFDFLIRLGTSDSQYEEIRFTVETIRIDQPTHIEGYIPFRLSSGNGNVDYAYMLIERTSQVAFLNSTDFPDGEWQQGKIDVDIRLTEASQNVDISHVHYT